MQSMQALLNPKAIAVIGASQLSMFAKSCYGDDDPARRLSFEQPFRVEAAGDRMTLSMHLPFVTRDDVQYGKPRPDLFVKAAQELAVQPERCLSLEDSHNGVRSAAAAGMMTIMVPDLLEATDEIRGLCTFVVRDLHVVRGLVLAAR